jgi:hypothetical protein
VTSIPHSRKALGDQLGRAHLLEADLRVAVDVVADGDEVRLVALEFGGERIVQHVGLSKVTQRRRFAVIGKAPRTAR